MEDISYEEDIFRNKWFSGCENCWQDYFAEKFDYAKQAYQSLYFFTFECRNFNCEHIKSASSEIK